VTYLSTFTQKVSRFWWWLWTGYYSIDDVRRRIESDARRFGGRVHWDE
jgi:hypothetical protein